VLTVASLVDRNASGAQASLPATGNVAKSVCHAGCELLKLRHLCGGRWMMVGGGGPDFFISYTAADEPWARWIAVELERAGYTTLIQAFDIRPGSDFIHEMQRAVSTSSRTIAVLSSAYVGSSFGESEWRVAFHTDPTGERGLLIPVRVQPCQPPGLLASRVFIDLVDADEETARRRLVDGVGRPGPRPTSSPFPGARPATPAAGDSGSPAFPGPRLAARPSPAPFARPRMQKLWTGDLVEALRTLAELERAGRVDIGALVDQAPFGTHVMRMVRHLLAQDPRNTAPFLMDLIRNTPVNGDCWQAARYAAYVLTPAHREYVAEELQGFLRGNVEQQRMALVALGSCAAHGTAADLAECALVEPPKLASWAADGLAQMLVACEADRLLTAGVRIIDALDDVLAADPQALLNTDQYLNSFPASHAYLLAGRWLPSGDRSRTEYAADALGYARATRARQELADRAVRAPEHSATLLRGLALIGGPEAVELLVARMDSPRVGSAAREALCLCLHDAPGSELGELIDRLLSAELRNRWAIFRAIGICDVPEFIGTLISGLESESATERGMAALGLSEFERSALTPHVRAVFEQATEASEILMTGLAVLRMTSDEDVFTRLDRAMIDAKAWALPPAIFDHVVAVLREAGGSRGHDIARAVSWIRSATIPTGRKLSESMSA